MDIKKSSWHYKLVTLFYSKPKVDECENLCLYLFLLATSFISLLIIISFSILITYGALIFFALIGAKFSQVFKIDFGILITSQNTDELLSKDNLFLHPSMELLTYFFAFLTYISLYLAMFGLIFYFLKLISVAYNYLYLKAQEKSWCKKIEFKD